MVSNLICVGLNHQQAPVDLRERIAFSGDRLSDALQKAVLEEHIEEAAILSTCNRIEIYAQGHQKHAGYALESFLHRYHQIPDKLLTPHLYHFQGQQALLQLMRVTSSLDSLVLGEPQILGQVKSAYAQAKEQGAVGPKLTRAFSQAFLTAKRVRTETELGKNAVTVAYAAVQLAQKVFGDLKDLRCLLIGQGEMGSLAAAHFKQKQAHIELANRQSNLAQMLEQADLVVASTSADHFLIEPITLKKIMRVRRYRPLFLIDIAVPRNIDPVVATLDNVYLYNIDDLSQVVASNLEERQMKVGLAEQIIHEELVSYQIQDQERKLAPVISDLQTQSLLIAEQELDSLLREMPLDTEQAQKIQEFTRQLTAKLFHQGVTAVKQVSRLLLCAFLYATHILATNWSVHTTEIGRNFINLDRDTAIVSIAEHLGMLSGRPVLRATIYFENEPSFSRFTSLLLLAGVSVGGFGNFRTAAITIQNMEQFLVYQRALGAIDSSLLLPEDTRINALFSSGSQFVSVNNFAVRKN
jgi:glutamyl-tRNA reductase